MTLDPQVERRLQTEQNLWLATVRPNGAPHLVPIWFVWVAGKIYLCTGADSVKVRNLLQNPQVSIALEDGSQPIVIEGLAQPVEPGRHAVLSEFQRKYDWDITSDDTYTQVIEIEPIRFDRNSEVTSNLLALTPALHPPSAVQVLRLLTAITQEVTPL